MFMLGADRAGTAGHPYRDDGGFTLVEMLMSLMLMSIVMAASAPFLVNSLGTVAMSRTQQVAVQVATDAIEQVRALRGSSLLLGRGEARSTAQWAAAPSEVRPYLDAVKLAWDPELTDPASTLGDQAAVSTATQSIALGGGTYDRTIYVGQCVQQAGSADGSCTDPDDPDPDPDSDDAPFFAVVVSVTWKHAACTAGRCGYVATTLVSAAMDPTFGLNRPPLVLTSPGSLTAYRTEAVSKQLKATGGLLPLTWTASGLPAGLTMSTSGLVTGTPTTLGTYTVTMKAVDRVGATDNRTFTWTVAPALVVTSPGDQISRTGTPLSLGVAATGGVTPLTWTATNLPAGLTVNATTGVISGTPTTVGSATTKITVTDSKGRAVSVSPAWQVLTPVQLTDPGSQTVALNGVVSQTLAASGGDTPYQWRATSLPAGLSLDPATGVISGTVTSATRYVATVYVKDDAGMEVSRSVVYMVSTSAPTDLRVTAPAATAPDQTGFAGSAVSLGASAAGGTGSGYTWTATNLPPGLTLTTGGGGATIGGTPNTKGTYLVQLVVKDPALHSAYLMFTWTVK